MSYLKALNQSKNARFEKVKKYYASRGWPIIICKDRKNKSKKHDY